MCRGCRVPPRGPMWVWRSPDLSSPTSSGATIWGSTRSPASEKATTGSTSPALSCSPVRSRRSSGTWKHEAASMTRTVSAGAWCRLRCLRGYWPTPAVTCSSPSSFPTVGPAATWPPRSPWRCTACFLTSYGSERPSTSPRRPSSPCSAIKRFEQLRNSLPADRIAPLRRNLGQRREHEPPFAEAWMRDEQPGLVHHGVPVQDEIEIQRARRAAVGARAAEVLFDGEELLEQGMRVERRDAGDRGVQHRRLHLVANVGSVEEGGRSQGIDNRLQPCRRRLQRSAAVADVAA